MGSRLGRGLSVVFGLFVGLGPLAAAPLMGPGTLGPQARAEFLHAVNPAIDRASALHLSLLYEEEASVEGVNPDLAFAQMLLETSFLRFGGQVRAHQNNFAGLGALDGGHAGLSFVSPRIGVRAQVQHLKYYGSDQPLVLAPVNPRLGFIRRGSAPTTEGLARAWASDPDYGTKLVAVLGRMEGYARTGRTSEVGNLVPPLASAGVGGDGSPRPRP